MHIKTYQDESFEYYKEPVLLIATTTCDFKCCIEGNMPISICQNEPWTKKPTYEIPNITLIQLYLNNPITKAICFAGFEPFKQWNEIQNFVKEFRQYTDNPIILYTGYDLQEVSDKVEWLKQYPNIIIKFGRFLPNQEKHYDEVLGVDLASNNQYAEVIS